MKKVLEQKEVFVAVDLGNTKLLAMAAERTAEGKLHILGEEEAPTPADAIRYGIICNATKVVTEVNVLLSKLNNRVKMALGTSLKIVRFYASVNGRTLHSFKISCSARSQKKIAFTAEGENNLRAKTPFGKDAIWAEKANFTLLETQLPKNFVYDLIPLEYYLDGSLTIEPAGILYTEIKVNYLAIASQRTLCENLRSFESKLNSYAMIKSIGAKQMGEIYLTSNEKQLGTALIDFGAKCTTMTIYQGGKLAYVGCLPLGGYDITHDLMHFDKRLDLYSAKILKGMGSAIVDRKNRSKISLPNVEGAVYEKSQIDTIINARQSEIFGYIAAEMEKYGFANKLPGGVVITGGASVVNGFDDLLQQMLSCKVRHLRLKDFLTPESEADAKRENAMILSLLLTATEPCCEPDNGEKPKPTRNKKGFLERVGTFFNDEL